MNVAVSYFKITFGIPLYFPLLFKFPYSCVCSYSTSVNQALKPTSQGKVLIKEPHTQCTVKILLTKFSAQSKQMKSKKVWSSIAL